MGGTSAPKRSASRGFPTGSRRSCTCASEAVNRRTPIARRGVMLRAEIGSYGTALGRTMLRSNGPPHSVTPMSRGDRERALAERERRLADVERKLVEHRDRDASTPFRAMRTHQRAAEIHDALAGFFPETED